MVLQASGDNLLQAVPALCARLAKEAPPGGKPAPASDAAVYLDFLGLTMVRWLGP